ncbi:MAG: hypothetical protein Q8877_02855 [Sweet potato little leaf phytoplasma]|nr:hypothetical protein [Sweet potato little leaf phytoplasma]
MRTEEVEIATSENREERRSENQITTTEAHSFNNRNEERRCGSENRRDEAREVKRITKMIEALDTMLEVCEREREI